MGVIGVILLVAFVIICILLICIVLLQNEEGGGLGGLFGGGSSTAFGSRSANVLTKTTYVLVTLFFVATFFLALINKSPAVKSLLPEPAAAQETLQPGESSEWWTEPSGVVSPSGENTSPIPSADAGSTQFPANVQPSTGVQGPDSQRAAVSSDVAVPEGEVTETPQGVPLE